MIFINLINRIQILKKSKIIINSKIIAYKSILVQIMEVHCECKIYKNIACGEISCGLNMDVMILQ